MTEAELDVLVVGGGVTGCGAALDAAGRGLTVGLVEQRDLASGTSSRSSKMFHGGLRYLEQFRFGLVSEALSERSLILRTLAPHLTTPVPIVYPLRRRWERPYAGSGVLLYDTMARWAKSPLDRHTHLSKAELDGMAPAIDPAKTRGGIRYWEALVDDARHTMTLGRTAALHGAGVATSARVVGMDRGEVAVADLESGTEMSIKAKVVVNATGVWSDDLQDMSGGARLDVEASKGIHLVVAGDKIDSQVGMILRTKASVLFVLPWGDHWIIGATDTPWNLHLAHPAASRADIEYILERVNDVLVEPVQVSDVVGVYAGLRPLLAGESDATSQLSREHAVTDNGRGMISVAGGKYTTYRLMARDAIDATARYLRHNPPPSKTDRMPLIGAGVSRRVRDETPRTGISEEAHARLVGRYGSKVKEIYALLEADPGLRRPVVEDAPYLGAEMLYGTTHEGALHLDDLLTRRTRISIETRHRGIDAASHTAALVADSLGWDEASESREIEHYRARVTAELESQLALDDMAADAARLGAPDVRTGSSE